jgi:DNA-binding MarR family transcriptional regulator
MMPSEIAEWTTTEWHNITDLTNRMRRDGLVTSERNINNKRLVNIKLTDKGRETLNKAMLVAQEVVNQVVLSTTESDATLLKEKLAILRKSAHYALEYLVKNI